MVYHVSEPNFSVGKNICSLLMALIVAVQIMTLVLSSSVETAWRQIHQGQEADSHCDYPPPGGQIWGRMEFYLWSSQY